ncbi:hypothetical protein WJX72_007918 [[Myrmecia] bisecta]|uniref:Cyanocobalamin reductase (cyanide-eliminating) n=1 Tax=[Myrmecia] bisecta TaxID=41462 RepID=A0AAW1PUR1_9CHLO
MLVQSPTPVASSSPKHLDNSKTWERILSRLKTGLALFGLDVVSPLALGWYNSAVPPELGVCIPVAGSAGDRTFSVLIGNTKNVWRPFLEACQRDPSLLQEQHPLDAYVERTVQAVTETVLEGQSCRMFWAHAESEGLSGGNGSRYVAMQRMAAAIGMAYVDNNSHLALHPKYGPWFALRCVLVFDGVEYTGTKPSALKNPLSPETESYIRMAVRTARNPSSDNLSVLGPEEPPSFNAVRRRWHKWVAIRDAPCPGHPWRYTRDQLEYHYTRSRAVLEKALRQLKR